MKSKRDWHAPHALELEAFFAIKHTGDNHHAVLIENLLHVTGNEQRATSNEQRDVGECGYFARCISEQETPLTRVHEPN
jgi:hypothetical protein